MFKKIVLCVFSMMLFSIAHAEVIDLDNMSPTHCQQQLTTTNQVGNIEANEPVVLMYMKDCPWAKKIMPIYEEIANEYPNRPFFRYEFSDASPLVAHYCFNGVMPYGSPQIFVFNVLISSLQGRSGFVNGIEKAGLDGAATKQDIIDFIGLNKATNKAFTLRKPHLS